MARSGLYKSDVEKARNSLIAMGKAPTVEAVRAALGSGSNTTIHKYLKELEAEAGVPLGQRVGLSDALTDLVTRLAAQLQQEADAVVTAAEARHRALQEENAAVLAAARAEAGRFATSLQQSEVALSTERTAHETTRSELAEVKLALASQTARLEGLAIQLEERDQRIVSLEQKHSQAREALEHFRSAAKEQRELELRRHDHALQAVQLELRQAADALTAKNHELQQLHRDNGRLLEQHATHERDLASLRGELRAAADRVGAVDAELSALRDASRTHAATLVQRDQAIEQLAKLERMLQSEADAHRAVVAERDRLLGKLQGLEDVVGRLEQRPAKKTARQDSLPLESPKSD